MIQIKQSAFNRNGVGGNYFYSILFTDDEKNFIAVANATNKEGNQFKRSSFNVVNIADLSDTQCGDVWADLFQNLFDASGEANIYDWLVKTNHQL